MARMLILLWTIAAIGGLYYFVTIAPQLIMAKVIFFTVLLVTGLILYWKYRAQWDIWDKIGKRWK